MAMNNVESPGGYMPSGMLIPGVDIVGSKKGYPAEKPWRFEDFDQITFYEVDEEEYDERQMKMLHSRGYEYEWEDVEFDLAGHNRLLRESKEEVVEIRRRQREAQEGMDGKEGEMLESWNREKEEGKVSGNLVEVLLHGMS
jgi:urea carboxylase